jgi:1,4-dihydroxy-2-naphthoyl-CoA synthase
LYAVGEEHVLVLMCEVLAALGEARCGVASAAVAGEEQGLYGYNYMAQLLANM